MSEAERYDWPEYKDCPFCGRRPRVQHFPTLVSVGCDPCQISMGFPGTESTHPDGGKWGGIRSDDNAKNSWNRRVLDESFADIPSPEELRKALDDYRDAKARADSAAGKALFAEEADAYRDVNDALRRILKAMGVDGE